MGGGGAEEVAVSSPPPVPIGATGLELIRLFQFLNLFQPAVIFKKVQNLWIIFSRKNEKHVFQKTKT